MDNVLLPTEIEFYIETMVPQDIRHVGNKQWLEWHQRLQKLNQQALIEASQLREEHVKETLITFQKTPVLVHEAILINIWKHKVLPQMLKLDPNPQNTFMGYTILYHEAVSVALLELVMYHGNCCDSLGDFSGDLLDYACGTTSQLLAITKEQPHNELLKQLEDLKFDIGIRCLSIIRYLAENLERLPLCTTSRMYTTCDIPILFGQILTNRPWIRDGKQYSAGKWMDWDGEALGQAEAQVWLALRQLLLDPACREYYTVTEARRAQLAKLMMLLTPVLMDQLAPLVELKQWLAHVTMGEQVAKGSRSVLLETVLEVKERIVAQAGGKWKKLAKEQLPVVFCNDQKTLMEYAQTYVFQER